MLVDYYILTLKCSLIRKERPVRIYLWYICVNLPDFCAVIIFVLENCLFVQSILASYDHLENEC